MNITYACMILGTALSIFLLCSSFQTKEKKEEFQLLSHDDQLWKIDKSNGKTYKYSYFYGKWQEMR